jgi:putative addiction module component (TIGR02574 family)
MLPPMSAQQLSNEALALPLAERVALAQTLWASLEEGITESDDRSLMAEVLRRDEELNDGTVAGRTHAEVMAAARRAIA